MPDVKVRNDQSKEITEQIGSLWRIGNSDRVFQLNTDGKGNYLLNELATGIPWMIPSPNMADQFKDQDWVMLSDGAEVILTVKL